ncbi:MULTISPECIES: hypothetical protein [Streptomyces rochei group]|uniref:hypothetical protein n=1 Tax=Streptomyces rochei group TaxID=2867164 RepID=UPI00187472FB|nr:hypothetical protein [Streptomyces vinaceusdrappus]GHC37193.1 hypothetical protein GCM10010308_64690 [Streptomyces vinaceusdrappus]
MPKNQSTAAKKARALQRAAGGKHTALLAGQTCGQPVHLIDDLGSCARPPHPADEPCSLQRDWDPSQWKKREATRAEEARARWEAMSPAERQDAEDRHREWLYDHDDEQPSDRIDFEETQ